MVQYLVSNDPTHLKALLARNRVHNHVTMYANKVLAIEYRVLVLTSRVDYLDREVLVPVPYNLAERVFDGRVIGIDEVTIDVLDR